MKKHTHPEELHLEEIWHQVPPDYYQKGVKENTLQRLWHSNKLLQVTVAIKLMKKDVRKILDVGSASGWFLSEVAKQFPKASCTGVDIYKDAISYGKKMYKNITLFHNDAHTLPFKAHSFDIVICCEVLEHVLDPKQVLLEIKRVLKDDGVAIIEIDTGNFVFKLVWFWWTNLRHGVWRDSHIHPFNVHVLERLFQQTGFSIKRKKIFNFSMAVVFTLVPKKKKK